MTDTTARQRNTKRNTDDTDRAQPIGAYIATLGSLILLVSVWLDWVGMGTGDTETDTSSGYEADSLIPFMGLLGVGLGLGLLYATKRADRGQHRGLSLASMAAGLASFLWILFFLIDPIETVKYAGYDGEAEPNVTTELGVWVGMIGALIWAAGSLILAKEPEGDIDRDSHQVEHHTQRQVVETHQQPAQRTRHAEVTETRQANVTDREVVDRRPVDSRPVNGDADRTTTRTGRRTERDERERF